MNSEAYRQSDEWQKLIEEQKAIFMQGGTVDRRIVNDMIARSWARSRSYSVDPERLERPQVSEDKLRQIMLDNAELMSCSKTVLDKMFSSMQESASALSVANAEGVTLYISNRVSHARFYPDAKIGCINTEEVRGTNGIGTCLFERAPIEIIGAEHYRHQSSCWSCSAAPIFSLDGELIGVLNVTQSRYTYHVHTLSMVKSAAAAIMEQLRLRRLLQQRDIIIKQLNDGILMVSPYGKIDVINNKAASILGIYENNTDCYLQNVINSKELVHFLMGTKDRIEEREMHLTVNGSSIQCMVSVFPLSDESRVIKIIEMRRMQKTATQLVGTKAVYTFDRILGSSKELRWVLELAQRVARNYTTVLILGESGTGKELFAQAIHNASTRSSQPFVAVNCGAIPRDLVESELFGYEGGAFTGAKREGKPGKFELADGGTIFLDEIGDLPLDVQVKLLRALQEGEVTRVGGKSSRTVSVRVIAATNKDLNSAIREHSFREDLYYRLNVFPLNLPPLRERKGDIEILAYHFLNYFAKKLNKRVKGVTPAVLDKFIRYAWPGNIRELENVVERMVNLMQDEEYLDVEYLPAVFLEHESPKIKNTGVLFSTEAQSIISVLTQCRGNMKQAAEILGVSRGGLYMKIKRLGIDINQMRK